MEITNTIEQEALSVLSNALKALAFESTGQEAYIENVTYERLYYFAKTYHPEVNVDQTIAACKRHMGM